MAPISLRLYRPITISKTYKISCDLQHPLYFPTRPLCHKEASGLSCLNWMLTYSLTRVNNERLILLLVLGNTHWETFQVSFCFIQRTLESNNGVSFGLFVCFVFCPSTSFIFKSLRGSGKIQIYMRNHKNRCNSSLRKLLIFF